MIQRKGLVRHESIINHYLLGLNIRVLLEIGGLRGSLRLMMVLGWGRNEHRVRLVKHQIVLERWLQKFYFVVNELKVGPQQIQGQMVTVVTLCCHHCLLVVVSGVGLGLGLLCFVKLLVENTIAGVGNLLLDLAIMLVG